MLAFKTDLAFAHSSWIPVNGGFSDSRSFPLSLLPSSPLLSVSLTSFSPGSGIFSLSKGTCSISFTRFGNLPSAITYAALACAHSFARNAPFPSSLRRFDSARRPYDTKTVRIDGSSGARTNPLGCMLRRLRPLHRLMEQMHQVDRAGFEVSPVTTGLMVPPTAKWPSCSGLDGCWW